MVLEIIRYARVIIFHNLVLPLTLLVAATTMVSADGRSSINDEELKSLFDNLLHTQSAIDANATSQKIWKIWTNDSDTEFGLSTMVKGVNLMNSNSLVAADKLFSNLVKSSPQYIEAWNKRATVRYLLGHFDSSLDDVNVVLSKEPNHFGALSGLGLIMLQKKDFEGALSAYKRVLTINPFSIEALRLVPILERRLYGKSI